jgi:hypothetical protein
MPDGHGEGDGDDAHWRQLDSAQLLVVQPTPVAIRVVQTSMVPLSLQYVPPVHSLSTAQPQRLPAWQALPLVPMLQIAQPVCSQLVSKHGRPLPMRVMQALVLWQYWPAGQWLSWLQPQVVPPTHTRLPEQIAQPEPQ